MRESLILLFVAAIPLAAMGESESVRLEDYARDIAPIFRRACYRCHGPDKQQGGLRLDRKQDALAGGEGGKVIIPGKPDASLLMRLISQPADSEDIMPQKGPPLTRTQIAKVRAWIEQGARWPDTAPGNP
jgi:mono/diheme cytochrome c family protein